MPKVYHTSLPTPPQGPTKVCVTCHMEKSFHCFSKNKNGDFGLENRCKFCRSPFKPHKSLVQQPLFKFTKRCSACKNEKAIEHFSKNKSHKDGYASECRQCGKAYNDAHKEYRKEISRIYRANLPDDWYEQNKERVLKNNKASRQNNPTGRRARDAKRLTLMHNSIFGKVNHRNILNRDGLICHICNGKVNPKDMEYDHVIPLVRGGSHTEDNIKVSHMVCNRRKKDKLVSEMTPYQRRGV